MSPCLKALWLTLSIIVLGLLVVASGLAQETPGEPEKSPEETPEAPQIPEEEAPALTVTATMCTAVQDREPVGAGETFPAAVGLLYCHTLVEGCEDSTRVTHAWFWGEEKMAEVTLPVASPRWRTWSSKKILESWTGDWHVDILSDNGTTLSSASFQIQ